VVVAELPPNGEDVDVAALPNKGAGVDLVEELVSAAGFEAGMLALGVVVEEGA